jgi:hypothetical protein
MPPIKSENQFKKPKKGKNRREYTQQEEILLLLKQLYIDVNDPRNEQILTVLREQKNEFLVRLFKEDSKNMLSDMQPFRHKLLLARNKDPMISNVFIPMLENEIVDSSKTAFYLEHLEQLFRDEAFVVHLNKRVKIQ